MELNGLSIVYFAAITMMVGITGKIIMDLGEKQKPSFGKSNSFLGPGCICRKPRSFEEWRQSWSIPVTTPAGNAVYMIGI